MAFFAQTGQTPMGRLSEQLGQSLGRGMGRGVGENIANKKQLQQQQGLAQLLFGQQAEGNPQAQQRMQQFSQLPPEVQLEAYKAMQPKAPAGGVTGQPIPPEEARAIKEVLEENPNADAETLGVKFTERNVRPVISSPYIESRRRLQESKEKQEQSKFKSDRDYHTQRAKPFLAKVDESRDSVSQKEQGIGLLKNALLEGNLGFLSQDYLSTIAPYSLKEPLKTAKGAQFVTAGKDFLLGNLKRTGGRPNMYIEQQISGMLPQIGRSKEANLSVVAALEAETELERKKIETTDALVDKYEKEYGYVPGNIAAMVDQEMKPYAQEVQKKLAYQLRDIQEQEMGERRLKKKIDSKVTQGTPLTLGMAKIFLDKLGSKQAVIEKAESLGYYVPSIEEWELYSK